MSNKADMAEHMGNIVIVLGMHRSGTSAFTGALKVAGFDLGKDLMQANEYNVKGYFENNKIVELNDKILGYFNASWDSMFFLPEKWEEDERLKQDKLKAIEIINSEFDGKNNIAIKDPRFGILLPFWKSVFKILQIRPNYCIVLRSPIEISLSLENRDHFSIQKSHILWTNYLMAMELGTRAEKRIFIDYPDFINSPTGTLKRHRKYFNLNDSFPLPETETAIEDFVSPKLRHHNSASTKSSDQVPAMINQYFSLLKKLAKNEESDKTLLVHLDQFYTEYQRISKFFYNKDITKTEGVEELRTDNEALRRHAEYLQNLLNVATDALEKNGIALDRKSDSSEEEARTKKPNADSDRQLKNKLGVLQATVLEYRNTIEDREQTIASREETIQKRDVAIGELRKEVMDLNHRVQESNKAFEHLKEQHEEKENTIQKQAKSLAHYDFLVRELTLDAEQKEKLIGELKSSISYRIGLFLTAPLRGTYEFFKKIRLAKFFLWLKFIPIILLSPLAFFRSINKRNLYTLKHALKNEDARTIYRNFKSLLQRRKPKTDNNIGYEQKFSKPEESKWDFEQKPLRSTVENIHSDFKHIQGSILFISHDAGLAGAQMILIHLMEWFAKHTNVDFKLLTLQDGPLLERFNNICPTLRWSQIIAEYPEFTKRQKHLGDWIGKVELIYGNTTVAPGVYDELAFLKAPFLTHVHELEISIQKYVSEHAQKNMHKYTDAYIACSNPVADNLNANHFAQEKQLITIHEFIDDYPKSNTKFRKKKLRSELNLEQDKFLVISCGNIYWRKGFDLFIETAVELLKLGETNFHFYWIGDNSWDDAAHPKGYPSWGELLTRMESTGAHEYITILGVKEVPRDYFLACDAFYLPAREDPYPLVCLEAAQCALPIICFKEAGGMPDFVENDAGFSVPFEDFKEAAHKIELLISKPKLRDKLGAAAKDKLENNHTVDSTAPKIISFIADNFSILNNDPVNDISVIIPTKNAGDEFEINLSMIRNQKINGTIEIVIVDSGSTDNTIAIAQSFGCHIINIKPEEFSHSYARNLGVGSASGKYLFITVQDATLPDEYFFQNMLDKLVNYQLDALSCAEEPRENCDLFYKVISENHYKYLGVVEKDVLFHKPSNLNDANEVRKNGQLSDIALLIPKNIMMNYMYRGNYAEDLDLGIRMVNDGRRVMFTGNLAVVHSHVRSAYYFLKRAFVDTKSVNKILNQQHHNMAISEIVTQLKTAIFAIHVLIRYVVYINNNFETFNKKIPKPSEFMKKAQLEAGSYSENINEQFIDKDLTVFLQAIQSYVDSVNGKYKLKQKLNIQGFTHILDSLHETAMNSTDNISSAKAIDLADYIQSLYKGYSLLLGSQLSFIYDSNDITHELKELLVNLSDEV